MQRVARMNRQLLRLIAPRIVGEKPMIWRCTIGCDTRRIGTLGLDPGSIRAVCRCPRWIHFL
eukprot:6012426-Pyramimonas_sp.AAC.1